MFWPRVFLGIALSIFAYTFTTVRADLQRQGNETADSYNHTHCQVFLWECTLVCPETVPSLRVPYKKKKLVSLPSLSFSSHFHAIHRFLWQHRCSHQAYLELRLSCVPSGRGFLP